MAKMIQPIDVKIKQYPTRKNILDYHGDFVDWVCLNSAIHQHDEIKKATNSLYSATVSSVDWHDDAGIEFHRSIPHQRTIATFYTDGQDVEMMVKRGSVIAKMMVGDGDTIVFDHRLKHCVVNTKPGFRWGAIITNVIFKKPLDTI